MPAPDSRLTELLGGPPPDSVAALPDADRARLTDLVDRARRQQSDSLEQAFADTLKHVPFPVRKIVRKVLLG